MHWNQLDCEACKEMVEWCIKNPDKWDDLGDYRQKMEAFRDYLTQHGVFTTIRASRGQDIFAACGLLSTAKKKSLGT